MLLHDAAIVVLCEIPWGITGAGQPLQTTQPDRDHVRAAQGLAAGCHPLRPVPEGLSLRRRARRNRHVLAFKQGRVLTLTDLTVWRPKQGPVGRALWGDGLQVNSAAKSF
jgi:hypothetical protein